jgi:hypothetical protein
MLPVSSKPVKPASQRELSDPAPKTNTAKTSDRGRKKDIGPLNPKVE